jgi:hypothetical protein
VDQAWSLGISVYGVAVQGNPSDVAYLNSLQRGDALKTAFAQANSVTDLDNILPDIGDHIPLAIVE